MQLGPLAPARPLTHAHTFTLPIQQDDILILASDGLSDNLWDEDVLDEVVRFRRPFLARGAKGLGPAGGAGPSKLERSAMAAMLSEALCSRARRVSELRRRGAGQEGGGAEGKGAAREAELDLPFARRAREHGKAFCGGKPDGALCFLLDVCSVGA